MPAELDLRDLLPRVLAHVSDPQIPGLRVEREPERVPQADRVDLRSPAAVRVRVVGRDSVRVAGVHVDPQHLAEQLVRVLGAIAGIAARTAVSEGQVQVPVRPERDRAAVVVCERLVDLHQELLGRRIERLSAVERGEPRQVRQVLFVRRDPVVRRIVQVDVAVVLEVRMERHSEQAHLRAVDRRMEDDVRDVHHQGLRVDPGIVVEPPHLTVLLGQVPL